MLVKMALSKSTIKIIDKTALYFNKYIYKASVTTAGAYWVRSSNDIDDFIKQVTERYEDWSKQKSKYPHGWYREPLRVDSHDLDLISQIIDIKNSLKNTDVRFRQENDTFSIYTNDEKLINQLSKDNNWKLEQINLSPAGIKYFKKDPPAKFRAYTTGNKVSSEFCPEMIEYLNRTPDLQPSNAFYQWLHRRTKYQHSHVWLWSNYFIDYNDERNLMMLRLMFPEAIGKTYKLEKKP